MGSFENVQHKEIRNLTAELDAGVRQLVKSGWTRAQVLDFVTELLDEPAGTIKEDHP